MGRKIKLEIGTRFGKLTVIGEADTTKHGAALWRCRCDCGNETLTRGASLRRGTAQSCGCIRRTPLEVGRRFGRLVVIGKGDRNHHGKVTWRCYCDCGNEVDYRSVQLKRGQATSCGCGRVKHGQSRTRVYQIWKGMLQRCTNPKAGRYEHYGGRGIKVHSDWTGPGGFEQFFDAIGAPPSAKHQIDRIDVDGDYEPENVRWVTSSENNKNRRPSHASTTLKRGQATSCGCGRIKHGMYGTKVYAAWQSMKDRCANPKATAYKDYGSRGIKVCKEWLGKSGFVAFYANVGDSPSPKHQLDRIDVDGNYEPGNVRWTTASVNQRNRRPVPRRKLDVGAVFGSWTVIAEVPHVPGTHSKYLCECVCGTQKRVATTTLWRGVSRSCGCRGRGRGR